MGCFFERGNGGFLGDRGKVVQKLIQRVAGLEIVDKRIDRNAGATEAGRDYGSRTVR